MPKIVIVNPATGLQRYPALVDKGESAALLLQEDATIAEQLTRQGLCRLVILRSAQQKSLIQSRLKSVSVKLTVLALHTPEEIQKEGLTLIFREAFSLDHCAIPRSKDAFEELLLQGKPRLIATAEKFESLVRRIVDMHFDVQRRLGTVIGKQLESAVQDIRQQLLGLMSAGYLSRTPGPWLQELPRYLQAIQLRLDKLSGQLLKDQENQRLLNSLEARRRTVLAHCDERESVPDDTRWLIEELRVSLFAQSLGTKVPVSEKRIVKRLEELERVSR